jgi:hypothetical protein
MHDWLVMFVLALYLLCALKQRTKLYKPSRTHYFGRYSTTEEQTDDINHKNKKATEKSNLHFQELCRARSKAEVKYNLSKSQVYQTIWGQLTLALQEELKSDATSYEQYDKSRDSLSLWIAVRYFCINGTQD